MSKKILFGSIAILFAAAAVFNINLLQNKNAGDISLENIISIANATLEIDGGTLLEVTIYGSSTYDDNTGVGSATIQWTSYWFSDLSNPTSKEEQKMREDLSKPRSEQLRTFHYYQGSHSVSSTVGWNVGFTAEGSYAYNFPSGGNSVQRMCCGNDFYNRCTHLPPCEAYKNMN